MSVFLTKLGCLKLFYVSGAKGCSFIAGDVWGTLKVRLCCSLSSLHSVFGLVLGLKFSVGRVL